MVRRGPTKDGRFLGQKYECAVCGLTGRRLEMVYQRGKLVHRTTCKDEPGARR